MFRNNSSLRLALAAGLFACAAQLGCAQHRIPAIDPTGEHIFSGTTTTLATHDWLHGGLHKHHQPTVVPVGPPVLAGPAVAAPPVKPPCAPPIEAVPIVPVVPVPVVAVPQNPLPAVPVVPVACGPEQILLPGQPQSGGPIYPSAAAGYIGPELRVTPARLVAPVNTEVVMAAGICSPN